MTYLTKEQNRAFLGDGSKNQEGKTLEEFLEEYDATKYRCPCDTVDMLVFRSAGHFTGDLNSLKLLLVRRKNHPSIGCWATPGGFVEFGESLDAAAARELKEETSVEGIPLIQLHTWGEPDRDPRWRIITTSYLALLENDIYVKAADDAADAAWFDVAFAEDAAGLCTLQLDNKRLGVSMTPKVQHDAIPHGILTEDRFTQLEAGGLAADHPKLITQALLYLKNAAKA